ncbi:MAG: ABC transporter ATP-binding protein [Burkholderiales bacterium]|nr:ABC transporter ATP-binding protein [Burkholderiales bacterium]
MSAPASSAAPLLEVRDLQVSYGGIRAVQGASLALHAGELVSLIGANGAGKTTLLNAVTGLLAPAAGSVWLDGQPLDRVEAWQRVSQGLVMVPEGRGIFARMSIEENLRMGAYLRRDAQQVEADLASVYQRFPRLKERRQQLAGTLSGGEQQMVAMGRALLARPRVLLLDEPSMGLSPLMVDAIFDVVRDIAAQGVTILLVEQNAHRALQMASRGYVMDSGRITLDGPAQQLLDDPKVREAYLGL